MRLVVVTRCAGLCVLWLFSAGCRAHPGQLAISLVEGYVDAKDVQKHGAELVGQSAETADTTFGQRHDTLVDQESGDRVLVYLEKRRKESETQWFVAVDDNGTITNLLKCKFNIEGLTDLHQSKETRARVLGKLRAEAEADAKLGEALRVFKSEENGNTICFYAPKGLVPKTYPAYSVLWYHRRLKVCTDNAMLGVIAGFTTDKLYENDDGSAGAPSSRTASGHK